MTPARYRQICGFALVALTIIVVTGAAVRLTESGLGCSDWPKCSDEQFHAEFELHAMIEFVNRVITGVVSVAVIAAVAGSLRRQPYRRDLVKLSLGLVAGVIGQIVLGGIVVLSHLNPWLVLGHFLLSMVLVANATVLYGRAGEEPPSIQRSGRGYRWAISGLTAVAIGAGTLVTGAGPHSGSHDDELIERLPLNVEWVTRVHGTIVICLIVTVIATLVRLRRRAATAGASEEANRLGVVLAVLLMQAGIGYLQYFTGVPVLLVGFHVAGATAVWIAVVWFHLNPKTGSRPKSDGSETQTPILVS